MKDAIKLLILGTGTYAMEVADLVSDIPNPKYRVVGFVRSVPPHEPGSTLLGCPIYWIDELSQFDNSYRAVCALGTTKRHLFTHQARELGMQFTTIVHPTARVSPTATVGTGTIISAGALVASHTEIGEHVIVNRGAIIGHHIKIGDHVTISPGANLAGNVVVGKRTYVGMGAIVVEKLRIGEQSIIGAAAVVTRDVPDRVKAMGMPARIIAKNVEGL